MLSERTYLFHFAGLTVDYAPCIWVSIVLDVEGGAGNQSCAIAKCSLQHDKVEYCFLCPDFPCPRYEDAEEYVSFITHQRQLRDIKRAQEIKYVVSLFQNFAIQEGLVLKLRKKPAK